MKWPRIRPKCIPAVSYLKDIVKMQEGPDRRIFDTVENQQIPISDPLNPYHLTRRFMKEIFIG